MALSVTNGKYWVLRDPKAEENLTLYDSIDEAIAKVKELLQDDAEPEEINLMEMNMASDKIVATSVSWSTISKAMAKM